MSTRRRTFTDYAALKRSRTGYQGNITKVADKLAELALEDISTVTTRAIDKLTSSLTQSEVGFNHTIELAPELIEKEEASDELLDEEDAAVESFHVILSDARHAATALLSLKTISKSLKDLTMTLRSVRDAFTMRPEADQGKAIDSLETSFAKLLQSWNDADHDDEHPLKTNIQDFSTQLAKLTCEMANVKDTTLVPSHDRSASSLPGYDTPRKSEGKIPIIEVPTFDGDIMQWSSFWTSWETVIGKRDTLSDAAKLSYLKKAITDPDCQTLLTDPRETEDCYQEVVKELHERFDRNKEVHRTLVQRLLQLTHIKETRADIRRLMDTLKSTCSSLKRTGSYCIETFLTSLVYWLLPTKLQTLWEQHTKKTKKVTPLPELIKYFSAHAETLPSINSHHSQGKSEPEKKNSNKKTDKRNDYPTTRSNTHKNKTSVHVVSPSPTYKWECALCTPEKHPLFVCPKWLSMPIAQKLSYIQSKKLCHNCLGGGHSTATCRSTYRCRECQANHHTSIHQAPGESTPIHSSSTHSSSRANSQTSENLMMTAQVLMSGPGGRQIPARALIDSGAGMSLVSYQLSQQLNLPLTKSNRQFTGVQGAPCSPSKHMTNFHLSPMHSNHPQLLVEAAVVPTVTVDLPARDYPQLTSLPHLSGLQLADPSFHSPGKIDLLLGADVYLQIMLQSPKMTGNPTDPGALETIFGWAVMGPVKASSEEVVQPIPAHVTQITPSEAEQLDGRMATFWESEEPNYPNEHFTSTEEMVEAHYNATTTYCPTEKRYTVSLPKKHNSPPLGESRSRALSRYISNESSILRKKVWKPFQDVIQGYLDLGHAEQVPAEELKAANYYLPMHSVTKQASTSTKLRVVFDGSASSTSGISLNQSIMVGPTLHSNLGSILLKFRSYKVAVTADISKMYREVSLSQPDRDLHRFLWRPTPQDEIKDYRMTRVTFGVSSSPYLAVRTLQQAAKDHGQEYPEASDHIQSSFYVDDLLAGAETPEEAVKLFEDLRTVLAQAGFDLRKWRSNSSDVLQTIPTSLREVLPVKDLTDCHSPTHPKALGLEWNSSSDTMAPAIQPSSSYKTTKRGVVSDVSKTFDILGWISPSVLQMKLLYQHLWTLKLHWDDQVPPDLVTHHSKWRNQLHSLSSKQLPRYYFRTDATPLTKELHGFADASLKAYGAVVYIRSTYSNHPPLVTLVVSKTRVAKLKPSTVPRQELCGALLLTDLLTEVKGILDIPDNNIWAWSDSSIVLSWLDGHPRDFKVFVSNRVSAILKSTSPSTWRHVPTAENPADCASRGLMPQELLTHSLWWEGPQWLHQEPIKIPWQPPRRPLAAPEQQLIPIHIIQPAPPPLLEVKFSSYHKLICVTAWCWRFYSKLKKKETSSGQHLTAKELNAAEHLLVRLSQGRTFPKERDALLHDQVIPPTSRILSLAPYMDQDLLLRVGGRLSNSYLTHSQKHPIITDSKDILIILLCKYLHVCLGHCGPTLLLAALSRRFHVVSARRLTRSVCSQCKVCRKAAPKPAPQRLGELPAERICISPAFTSTGLDFAGPFTLKKGHTRKPVYIKAYLCVFVCLSTKAIHLEVISDLTTSAFLAGFNRFISRRGCPTTIHSDNGSNFVGAKNRLKEVYTFLQSKDTDSSIHQHLLKNRITWNNIPERTPHFGGLWESAVRTMKYHLKRVVGAQILTYEELSTVSAQVEACMNSRPLTATTSHTSDGISTLTPGHFLILKPPTVYPDYPELPEEPCRTKKWLLCQSLVRHFWDRWSKEYITTLQARTKWKKLQPNLQLGDVVILKEDKTFTCHWPLARVIQTYPGTDGLVRVALVKTATSVFKRPVTKLALLHRDEPATLHQVKTPSCLPPGGCLDNNPARTQDQVTSIGKMPEALPSQRKEDLS